MNFYLALGIGAVAGIFIGAYLWRRHESSQDKVRLAEIRSDADELREQLARLENLARILQVAGQDVSSAINREVAEVLAELAANSVWNIPGMLSDLVGEKLENMHRLFLAMQCPADLALALRRPLSTRLGDIIETPNHNGLPTDVVIRAVGMSQRGALLKATASGTLTATENGQEIVLHFDIRPFQVRKAAV